MVRLLLLLFILHVESAFSKCIRDIFTVGSSAKSYEFGLSKEGEELTSLATSSAYNVNLTWVNYCADTKREYLFYTNAYFLGFSEKDETSQFMSLEEDEVLFDFGLEARQLYMIGNLKTEFLFEVIYAKTLGLYSNSTYTSLETDTIDNAYFNTGFRIPFWQKNDHSLLSIGKVGFVAAVGESEDIKNGFLFNLGVEHFYKVATYASIKTDLIYQRSQQDSGVLDLNQKELSLGINVLFRW